MSDRPSGQRCPRCGEQDMHYVEHDQRDLDHQDCPKVHLWCANCDNGLCCGDC